MMIVISRSVHVMTLMLVNPAMTMLHAPSALINRPSLTVTNNDAGGSRMEVSGGAAVEDN